MGRVLVPCTIVGGQAPFGMDTLEEALRSATGLDVHRAEVRVEVGVGRDGSPELVVEFVNRSPEQHTGVDTRLYECTLELSGLATRPFSLESLPDSFRYDRSVPAYGQNCGVEELQGGGLRTVDAPTSLRRRPHFWNPAFEAPDLRFATLAADPIPALERLATAHRSWGDGVWSDEVLDGRAATEWWSAAMREEAQRGAEGFRTEIARIQAGLDLLRGDDRLLRCFRLMNRAIAISASGKYDAWRPFQVGFLLANLRAVAEPTAESGTADIVWFATGGGKTETYLGLLVTAAFLDRLRGKDSGVTAWSRFPLRLLSLQQTQRFANALAGAEIVRREEGIGGDPFSLGFFVGDGSTPNRLDPDAETTAQWYPYSQAKLEKAKVVEQCPFCREEQVSIGLDETLWRLEHRCGNPGCAWTDGPLPIFVVDNEIYRFLPTVVVGTLDKAASIAFQASMRGLVGPPLGRCPRAGHGWTYSPRSKTPKGCLVPGCNATPTALTCDPALFGPSYRLQDELHLLRDSLGAVDAHYEGLYDDLQQELCGARPKILASSATLAGYRRQVDVLYRREARVFPEPGPSPRDNFWATPSDQHMRRFVALAPRGVTIEFATDRLLSILQGIARRLQADPIGVCAEAGVDSAWAASILSNYGTNVVYGNTLRDLDAVERSAETQIRVDGPPPTVVSLTGRTGFDEVRKVLNRLERPEGEFLDRVHVVSASSMMSHGVDVDRLNVMVMLGLPLGTAEFIQATARVGRRWPGVVFVVHKIGRERDAAVFRNFEKFVEHGDRFVETIPITRRSRRVLERTIPGLELARVLALHETRYGSALTTIAKLRAYLLGHPRWLERDREEIKASVAADASLDVELRDYLDDWFRRFERNIRTPPVGKRFTSEASPTRAPMLSLRDVEEQVPIYGDLR
ncbi:helicase-related protein [Roseomonas cutis]|uniref:helicase-related protein n=1 Tax=Roseomonas cutis TaxID=2897332 RepID=UPI00351D4E44